MREASNTSEALDVLWDFHQAHPLPTAKDVREWQRRHPEYADLIEDSALMEAEAALAPEQAVEKRQSAATVRSRGASAGM